MDIKNNNKNNKNDKNDKNYDKKCNIYFKSNLNDKYNIYFHSDNNLKFIILKKEYLIIWAKYKILCSYDIKNNFLLTTKNMIIIEKELLDTSINLKNKDIKNITDLEIHIKSQIFNNEYNEYIGYIKSQYEDIVYYYLIREIIRL